MIAGYRLETLVESVGSSEFYLARQEASGQQCLIRILTVDEKKAAGFLKEAETAAAFFHPNVAGIYDLGTLSTGENYIITEAAEGHRLRELLREVGVPTLLTAVLVARQTAEALYALHLNGLTHRALNPANIILTSDADQRPHVKIQNIDFGGVGEASLISNKFLNESGLYSLRYFAPEQCSGEASVPKTDLYSLGIIFYEMLAGVPPFEGRTAPALIHEHKNQQPPEIKIDNFDLRMLLTHTLSEALQKRPASRQSSANTFARQLRHIEQLKTHISTPPPARHDLPGVAGTAVAPAQISSGVYEKGEKPVAVKVEREAVVPIEPQVVPPPKLETAPAPRAKQIEHRQDPIVQNVDVEPAIVMADPGPVIINAVEVEAKPVKLETAPFLTEIENRPIPIAKKVDIESVVVDIDEQLGVPHEIPREPLTAKIKRTFFSMFKYELRGDEDVRDADDLLDDVPDLPDELSTLAIDQVVTDKPATPTPGLAACKSLDPALLKGVRPKVDPVEVARIIADLEKQAASRVAIKVAWEIPDDDIPTEADVRRALALDETAVSSKAEPAAEVAIEKPMETLPSQPVAAPPPAVVPEPVSELAPLTVEVERPVVSAEFDAMPLPVIDLKSDADDLPEIAHLSFGEAANEIQSSEQKVEHVSRRSRLKVAKRKLRTKLPVSSSESIRSQSVEPEQMIATGPSEKTIVEPEIRVEAASIQEIIVEPEQSISVAPIEEIIAEPERVIAVAPIEKINVEPEIKVETGPPAMPEPLVHRAKRKTPVSSEAAWQESHRDIPSTADVLETVIQERESELKQQPGKMPVFRAKRKKRVIHPEPPRKIEWQQPVDDIPSSSEVQKVLATDNVVMQFPVAKTEPSADLPAIVRRAPISPVFTRPTMIEFVDPEEITLVRSNPIRIDWERPQPPDIYLYQDSSPRVLEDRGFFPTILGRHETERENNRTIDLRPVNSVFSKYAAAESRPRRSIPYRKIVASGGVIGLAAALFLSSDTLRNYVRGLAASEPAVAKKLPPPAKPQVHQPTMPGTTDPTAIATTTMTDNTQGKKKPGKSDSDRSRVTSVKDTGQSPVFGDDPQPTVTRTVIRTPSVVPSTKVIFSQDGKVHSRTVIGDASSQDRSNYPTRPRVVRVPTN